MKDRLRDREEFAEAYAKIYKARGGTMERGREVWDLLHGPEAALTDVLHGVVVAVAMKAARDRFERENACDKCGQFGFGCYCGGRGHEPKTTFCDRCGSSFSDADGGRYCGLCSAVKP